MTAADHRGRELTAELVADGAAPQVPALSPDGRWVVYAVAPLGRVSEFATSQLWIAPVDGHAPPRRLTTVTAEHSSPQWSPDSRSIFFLCDRAAPGIAQLCRIGLADGAVAWLTAWSGGIRAYRLLADPGLIAVIADDEATDEDERRIKERDDAQVRTSPRRGARLRLLDLRTSEIHGLHTFRDRHVVEVVQRPDGGPLAVLTWASPDPHPGVLEPELHLLDPRSGSAQNLGPARVEAHSLAWHLGPSGWHLAYLALTPPGLQAGLAVFEAAVPETWPVDAHRNLTAGMTMCPTELVQTASGVPLGLIADGLDTKIFRLTSDGLHIIEGSRVSGLAESICTDPSGRSVAVIVSTAYEPKNVHTGPPDGPMVRVSDTRSGLRVIDWGAQQRLSYTASDGLALDGLLILPAGKSRQDGPFPLVTLVHGGPYGRHADQLMLSWAPSGQWLATAGYAVFLPNPRGGQGHGHAFAASVAGAVGRDEWTDILTGIDLLISDGIADPDRLGIGGWSHGGFMAAWAAGHSHRFKAALVGAGVSDWGMLAATGEAGPFEAALGGSTGWEGAGPHLHDQRSPISFASRIRTPVLILHGERDPNVPLSQAEYLHRALRHYGVTHEYVVYPREEHHIHERNHQLDLLRRTREWFDRWLTRPTSGPVQREGS